MDLEQFTLMPFIVSEKSDLLFIKGFVQTKLS